MRRRQHSIMVAVGLCGIAAVFATADATARQLPATAHVRGAMLYVGGPAPGDTAPKAGGTVTIRRIGSRKAVARQKVKARHDFSFTLRPGRYALSAVSGDAQCRKVVVRAEANRTVIRNVPCTVR